MWRFLLVICVLVPLFAAMACEPGHLAEFENATPYRVTVYKDGTREFSLEPYEAKNPVGSFPEHWSPDIKVVAEDGRVLLEDHITWDEVKQMGYKIVITDPPSPTPTPSPVATPAG